MHELKIQPEFFSAIEVGVKTFEIRKNDRNFKIGQYLILNEYCEGEYSGRKLVALITYITDYEQKENFVVMGIHVENYYKRLHTQEMINHD